MKILIVFRFKDLDLIVNIEYLARLAFIKAITFLLNR